MDGNESADLLYGAPAIAEHLRLRLRQVHHLAATGKLPTFKIGKTVCARRSSLATWIVEREAAALADAKAGAK